MEHILTSRELREEIERNVREWLEREAEPGDLNCFVYDCDGRKRFILYGTCPATRHKADKLFKSLLKIFGLNEKRGPKRKRKRITLEDVRKEMEELSPDAGIAHLARALDVEPRDIPRLLKQIFREEQAARRAGQSQLEDTSLEGGSSE